MNKWTSFKRHSLSIALRPTNFNEKSFISGILYQISLHKGISMNNYKTEFSNVLGTSSILIQLLFWVQLILSYNSRIVGLDQNIIRKGRELHQVSIKSHNTNIFIVIKTNCMNIILIL